MGKEDLNKYSFWVILTILAVLSYILIKPFIIPIISAFILAYLLKPLYKKIEPGLGKSIAAILCIILILSVLIIPLGLILSKLTQEISSSLSPSNIRTAIEKIKDFPIINSIDINKEATIEQLTSFAISITKNALIKIPSLLISILITFLGIFYILKNWDFLEKSLRKHIPFKNKEHISSEIGKTTKNIIYGYLLIAIIEFVLAFIAFSIAGVKYPLLLSALLGIMAFVPIIGPILIWGPLALFQFLAANYTSALIITVVGLIISIGVDNILAPKIVGHRAKINPFIMLIGILGGVSLFGIFGFIIGPLILTYTIKIIEEAAK